MKKTKALYWIFTLLFSIPMLASGIAYLAAVDPVVQGMAHLGYPPYLVRFLGVAKLLGALTVLFGTFPRIKEWAYAGFVFNLAGAFYSHISSGDGPKAFLPVIILVFELLSYFHWKKLATSPPKPPAESRLRQQGRPTLLPL